MTDPSSLCGTPSPGKRKANPVSFEGSLIYWLEVPSDQQHYIQGILEGYDDLGYYQTMVHEFRETAEGVALALGRITSTEDVRKNLEALLSALVRDYGLRVLEESPDIPPDEQPLSRKIGRT